MAWQNKTFGWAKQLGIGNSYQQQFFDKHAAFLLKTKGHHSGDFKVVSTGKQLELKSDQYHKTDNFFIERWSNKDEQKPGGPWQARRHGTDYFIYWFPHQNEIYLFDVELMIEALDIIIPTLKPVDIKNISYTTQGYKVPKSHLISDILELTKDNMQHNRQGYMGTDVTILFK